MGSVDRPPDLVAELRSLKSRLAELEARQFGIVAAGRKYEEDLTEVSTTLTGPTDLGGPSIEVTIAAGAFVAIYTECDIKTGGVGTAAVWLYEPTDLSAGAAALSTGSATYVTMKSVPGSLSVTTIGGQLVHVPTAGSRTYSLRYSISSGTGFFKNRKLWVEVF